MSQNEIKKPTAVAENEINEAIADPIILDTETHDLHGLPIEIAYGSFKIKEKDDGTCGIDFDHNNIFDEYYSIRGEPISYASIGVHHILEEDIVGKPDYSEFQLPNNVKYIIGHNVDYDIPVIGKCGIDTSTLIPICTLAMAREAFQGLPSYAISPLLYALYPTQHQTIREKLRNAHNAKVDIQNTAYILQKIVRRMQIKTIEELREFSDYALIPKVMAFGKHKGERLENLPASYVTWLLNQPDTDKRLVNALRNM